MSAIRPDSECTLELLIARLEARESRGEVPRSVPEARLGVTGSGRVVRLSYLRPAIRN